MHDDFRRLEPSCVQLGCCIRVVVDRLTDLSIRLIVDSFQSDMTGVGRRGDQSLSRRLQFQRLHRWCELSLRYCATPVAFSASPAAGPALWVIFW